MKTPSLLKLDEFSSTSNAPTDLFLYFSYIPFSGYTKDKIVQSIVRLFESYADVAHASNQNTDVSWRVMPSILSFG